jgi:hypothetical protein
VAIHTHYQLHSLQEIIVLDTEHTHKPTNNKLTTLRIIAVLGYWLVTREIFK